METDFTTWSSNGTCPAWLERAGGDVYFDGHVNISDEALNQEMLNGLLEHDQSLACVEFELTTLEQLLDTEQGRHLLWNNVQLRNKVLESHLRAVLDKNYLAEESEKQELLDFLLVSTSPGRLILNNKKQFSSLVERKRLGAVVPHGDCKGMSFLFYLLQNNFLGVIYLERVAPVIWQEICGEGYCLLSEVAKEGIYSGQSVLFWMLKYKELLDSNIPMLLENRVIVPQKK